MGHFILIVICTLFGSVIGWFFDDDFLHGGLLGLVLGVVISMAIDLINRIEKEFS